jgi:hypothetical protein
MHVVVLENCKDLTKTQGLHLNLCNKKCKALNIHFL